MKYKTLSDLTFADDYMFCKVLQRNMDLTKEILEVILEREITKIDLAAKQEVIDPFLDSKSVRFDIYLKGDDEIYDVEMQTTNKADLILRSRYYLSANDLDCLKKGEKYQKLPKSFIIFICTFDPFDMGYNKYISEERLFGNEHDITAVKYDAKYQKIYLNASTILSDNDSLSNFLNYVNNSKVSDELTSKLNSEVLDLQHNVKEAKTYMFLQEKYDYYFEKGIEKGIGQGIEKGKIEKTQEFAIKLLKETPQFSIEKISDLTSLSVDEIKELQKSLQSK